MATQPTETTTMDIFDYLDADSAFEYCDHCNGYGSSLKDPTGVNTCTKCHGTGLQYKKKTLDKSTV
jgi:DnaJ-class molecular chaperone